MGFSAQVIKWISICISSPKFSIGINRSGITYSEAEAYGKLLHLRELVRPHIRHSIGDGQHSMLWFDYWLPSGPILSTINEQVIDDSRLGRNCLVSVIVDGTRWRWPSTNTIHFLAARDLMPVDLSPDPSRRDTIQWAVQVMRGKSLATLAKKLSLTLSVYYIWAERNARWHNNPTRDAIQLSKLII